jgi:tryptophan-rich sensory protein
MTTTYALLVSVGVGVLAAALEGACAGNSVKSYFATLRSPSYAAPLWVWYIIGVGYYATFFFILNRILTLKTDSLLRPLTLGLVLFMMISNALWNYLFFRARKLFIAFVTGSAAPIFDTALLISLVGLDRLAAWSLVPYLPYMPFTGAMPLENEPSLAGCVRPVREGVEQARSNRTKAC